MKLINADKYKKDIEHYRNTICYQRNVTMDDCMRILDKQEDVLDEIRAEIIENSIKDYEYHGCGTDELMIETSEVLQIIDKYKVESEDKERSE